MSEVQMSQQAETTQANSINFASGVRRLLAFLYDFLFLLLINLLVLSWGLYRGARQFIHDAQLAEQGQELPPLASYIQPLALLLILGLFFSLLYQSIADSRLFCKGSLGKCLLRLEVQTNRGDTPSLLRSLLRESLKLIFSLASLGLANFWVYLDPRRRALHDILSGTVVLRSEKSNE